MRLALYALLVVVWATPQFAAESSDVLTDEQELVIASYTLDLKRVKSLLEKRTDPNAVLGSYDERSLVKGVSSHLPLGHKNWTPLLAVANSSLYFDDLSRVKGNGVASQSEPDTFGQERIAHRNELSVGIARLLINAKAEPNVDDGYGTTPLHAAVCSEQLELVRILIQANAAVNTKARTYIDDPGGVSPIHMAVNNPHILEELIRAGASVDATDNSGLTPLHYAVRAGSLPSVRRLLNAGANPKAVDSNGRRPSEWCNQFDLDVTPNLPPESKLAKMSDLAKEILARSPWTAHQLEIAELLREAESK